MKKICQISSCNNIVSISRLVLLYYRIRGRGIYCLECLKKHYSKGENFSVYATESMKEIRKDLHDKEKWREESKKREEWNKKVEEKRRKNKLLFLYRSDYVYILIVFFIMCFMIFLYLLYIFLTQEEYLIHLIISLIMIIACFLILVIFSGLLFSKANKERFDKKKEESIEMEEIEKWRKENPEADLREFYLLKREKDFT